jgi:hypothetical protein
MNRFNPAAAAALPVPAPTAAAAGFPEWEAWLDKQNPSPADLDAMAREYEREARAAWNDDQREGDES